MPKYKDIAKAMNAVETEQVVKFSGDICAFLDDPSHQDVVFPIDFNVSEQDWPAVHHSINQALCSLGGPVCDTDTGRERKHALIYLALLLQFSGKIALFKTLVTRAYIEDNSDYPSFNDIFLPYLAVFAHTVILFHQQALLAEDNNVRLFLEQFPQKLSLHTYKTVCKTAPDIYALMVYWHEHALLTQENYAILSCPALKNCVGLMANLLALNLFTPIILESIKRIVENPREGEDIEHTLCCYLMNTLVEGKIPADTVFTPLLMIKQLPLTGADLERILKVMPNDFQSSKRKVPKNGTQDGIAKIELYLEERKTVNFSESPEQLLDFIKKHVIFPDICLSRPYEIYTPEEYHPLKHDYPIQPPTFQNFYTGETRHTPWANFNEYTASDCLLELCNAIKPGLGYFVYTMGCNITQEQLELAMRHTDLPSYTKALEQLRSSKVSIDVTPAIQTLLMICPKPDVLANILSYLKGAGLLEPDNQANTINLLYQKAFMLPWGANGLLMIIQNLYKSGIMTSDNWERLLAPESNSLLLRLTQQGKAINFLVDDAAFNRMLSSCRQEDVFTQCMNDLRHPSTISAYPGNIGSELKGNNTKTGAELPRMRVWRPGS